MNEFSLKNWKPLWKHAFYIINFLQMVYWVFTNRTKLQNTFLNNYNRTFMVGSLVELSATMVGPRRKIKEKYLLKRLNAVLKKKRNLDQNINDSKSQIWNSFFKNIISGIQLFCVRPHDPVDIIRVFLISYLLAESLKASQKSFKLHRFSSKHVSAWCQKKKLYCTISWLPRTHSWALWKQMSIYFWISLWENSCSKGAIIFYLMVSGLGRGWIISLRQLNFWAS